MSPKEHMERFARRVPGGGIAWESSVFNNSGTEEASRLVDAAVDIAWERLLDPSNHYRSELSIGTQGRLLVFHPSSSPREPELPFAA